MKRIYIYKVTETALSILEIKDIDIAIGNVKGRDLYTGRMIKVNREDVLDRLHFTEEEIARIFPNYPLI